MDFLEGKVTIQMASAGKFKKNSKGNLEYIGGECRNFLIDVDELCWWWLEEFATKCGPFEKDDEIHYLFPNMSFEGGLIKVYHDHEVREMSKSILEWRMVKCFVVKSIDSENLKRLLARKEQLANPVFMPQTNSDSLITRLIPRDHKAPLAPQKSPSKCKVKPSKINEKTDPQGVKEVNTSIPTKEVILHKSVSISTGLTSQTSPNIQQTARIKIPQELNKEQTPNFHLCYDDRPNSPFPLNDLTEYDIGHNTIESDYVEHNPKVNGEFISDLEESDKEYVLSREKVKGFSSKVIEIAKKLQEEAIVGKLVGQSRLEGVTEVGRPAIDNEYISEYENSEDETITPNESEEETIGERKKRVRVPVLDENTNYSTLVWRVGIRAENKKSFRDAVAKYAIAQGRNLKIWISQNTKNQRVGVKCVEGCDFKLYATWDTRNGSYVVRSVKGEHTCNRNMESNIQMKACWVADQFLEVFKTRPHWPAKEIIETIKRAFKTIVKPAFAYKVKRSAHLKLHGSMRDHYNKVGRYLEAMKVSDPLSTFLVLADPTKEVNPPIFQRFFICFDGLVQGWLKGARKVLCIDGCFIKTLLGGMLLSAVGRDANDQMFPMAWAVVEGENNSSWGWFLNELKKKIDCIPNEDLTFISDKHQSILFAVSSVFPNAEHRHCARHLFANWHKKHRGEELKLLFWKAAKAYNEADFEEALGEMENVSPQAVDDFKRCNPKVFCRPFLRTQTKCDVIVSNMVETFNGYVIHARTKHLIMMLEEIRTSLMERVVLKRGTMENNTALICPRIKKRLEKEKDEAAKCDPTPSSAFTFQVAYYLDVVSVDLHNRSCTCRRWNLTGIPCRHAIACIFYKHEEAEKYIDMCYGRQAYLDMYSGTINSIPGERYWPKVDMPLDPPPVKVGVGRPK